MCQLTIVSVIREGSGVLKLVYALKLSRAQGGYARQIFNEKLVATLVPYPVSSFFICLSQLPHKCFIKLTVKVLLTA